MKNVKHLLLSLRGSVALCPEDLALLLSPPIMGLEWVMSSGVLRPAENGTPSPVGSVGGEASPLETEAFKQVGLPECLAELGGHSGRLPCAGLGGNGAGVWVWIT